MMENVWFFKQNTQLSDWLNVGIHGLWNKNRYSWTSRFNRKLNLRDNFLWREAVFTLEKTQFKRKLGLRDKSLVKDESLKLRFDCITRLLILQIIKKWVVSISKNFNFNILVTKLILMFHHMFSTRQRASIIFITWAFWILTKLLKKSFQPTSSP